MTTTTARRRKTPGDGGAAPAAALPPRSSGVKQWGPMDILSAPENRDTVVKLAYWMVILAVLPPAAFFVARRFQAPAAKYRDAISAIAAVLVLNAVLVGYVVSAFSEPNPDGSPVYLWTRPPPGPRVGIWKDRRAE